MADKMKAEVRESFGKGAARKIRAAGKIPAVVYGHGTEPQHLTLPGHEMSLLLRKANALIELDIAGSPQVVLVKDVQKDPVRQIIEHIDLVIIRTGEKVEVDVAVHLEGESAPGTIANLDATTISLLVPAISIPESVTVSIEGLEAGTQITASDIALPEGAELISEPDLLIVGVMDTAAEESEEGETEGAEDAAE
jgi:large subunit ribosomal protein L25